MPKSRWLLLIVMVQIELLIVCAWCKVGFEGYSLIAHLPSFKDIYSFHFQHHEERESMSCALCM
jgi:hypothetical protein